jgi:hypothetical protein
MALFAVQYLEDSPEVAEIDPQEARDRLRAAFKVLPISYVLLGWSLSEALFDACAEETARAGARLYRWHPLLTGDGEFVPRPEWQTVGLDGEPVPGFRGTPEFTFVCPNRLEAREAVIAHMHDVLRRDRYQGIFLDRIRYPSPAPDPSRLLSCFCKDCHRAAWAEGLNLEDMRRQVLGLLSTLDGAHTLVDVLLDRKPGSSSALDVGAWKGRRAPDAGRCLPGDLHHADAEALQAFLRFRAGSVSRFVEAVAGVIHDEGLEVGLDCFSPALTWMVGQDLRALDACCEWIKVMSYGHTMGPAGLPFELLGLADWLVEQYEVSEAQAMDWLSAASRLELPSSRGQLCEWGLAPQALGSEVRRARAAGVRTLLAGIELVELEGITQLNEAQIAADLSAVRVAGADGLALSWDLWHISPERLEWVRWAWM